MRPLSRDEVRSIDRRAIDAFGMPGVVLMENAGRNAAAVIDSLSPGASVLIACGKGNNAGDGFVIARHLELLGHDVRLVLAASPRELAGDAALNYRIAERSGIPIADLSAAGSIGWRAALIEGDESADFVLVDALLGTGAQGPPRATVATAIAAINAARTTSHRTRVVAIDLPSGLDCDTGTAAGECVRADTTVTFVARKRGFDTPEAGGFTGTVHVVGIGAPKKLLAEFE
jgi:NAD(P)H-hydrate epimerase